VSLLIQGPGRALASPAWRPIPLVAVRAAIAGQWRAAGRRRRWSLQHREHHRGLRVIAKGPSLCQAVSSAFVEHDPGGDDDAA